MLISETSASVCRQAFCFSKKHFCCQFFPFTLPTVIQRLKTINLLGQSQYFRSRKERKKKHRFFVFFFSFSHVLISSSNILTGNNKNKSNTRSNVSSFSLRDEKHRARRKTREDFFRMKKLCHQQIFVMIMSEYIDKSPTDCRVLRKYS